MELSTIQHIDPDRLNLFEADLFITHLSHESRCISVARMMESNPARKVVLTSSCSVKEFAYKQNNEYFMDRDYQVVEVQKDSPDLGQLLKGIKREEIRLFIDCTCMPQHWYYKFLNWFADDRVGFTRASLRFAYTMAGYSAEGPPLKMKKVREFVKNGQRGNKKKRAMLLGLGHEAGVSDAIFKEVKPDLVYLYYADPPVDKRFVEKLFVNNHGVINSTPIRNLIAYPIHNGQEIYQNLIDTILPLRSEYAITLIPQGPKVFSLASMLVQIGYPDTSLSYPLFKKSQVSDRYPTGEPVILDVLFEEEE